MISLLDRFKYPLLGLLGVLIAVSLVMNFVLMKRVADAEDRIEEVAGGAGLVINQANDLFRQLDELTPLLNAALADASTELEAFENSTIAFDVNVDQVVPIATSIPFQRTLNVPINTVLPIDEIIDTTITVEGPLGIDVDLDVQVPIRLDVPIDLTVNIPVDETIEVNTEIPFALSVPVRIDVGDTDLARLSSLLRDGIAQLQEALRGL